MNEFLCLYLFFFLLMVRSSDCQISKTLAHSLKLRLGKGCKTLLSLYLQHLMAPSLSWSHTCTTRAYYQVALRTTEAHTFREPPKPLLFWLHSYVFAIHWAARAFRQGAITVLEIGTVVESLPAAPITMPCIILRQPLLLGLSHAPLSSCICHYTLAR